MESVTKAYGTIHEGQIVTDGLPFAEGESVELMVWSPRVDNLAPDPPAERTPEAREAALRAWMDRIEARHPRLPSLSDYSMSRECIYRDEEF